MWVGRVGWFIDVCSGSVITPIKPNVTSPIGYWDIMTNGPWNSPLISQHSSVSVMTLQVVIRGLLFTQSGFGDKKSKTHSNDSFHGLQLQRVFITVQHLFQVIMSENINKIEQYCQLFQSIIIILSNTIISKLKCCKNNSRLRRLVQRLPAL